MPESNEIPQPGPVNETPPTPAGDGNQTSNGNAILQVALPQKAKVFVNGKLTKTKGDTRKYVSRNLKSGRAYSYEITAVLNQKTLTQIVELRAGQNKNIEFDFDRSAEQITSVTVFAPKGAQMTLAGNKSTSKGNVRYFSTKALEPGQKWSGYTVEISYEVDGKKVTQSKTIDVIGGKSHEIRFDEEAAKIALK